jgi:hypothetical protein
MAQRTISEPQANLIHQVAYDGTSGEAHGTAVNAALAKGLIAYEEGSLYAYVVTEAGIDAYAAYCRANARYWNKISYGSGQAELWEGQARIWEAKKTTRS